MSYLAAVTHYVKDNVIEATWLEQTDTGFVPVKCHTYSPSQRDMVVADLGEYAERYLTAAGWTQEFCDAFKAAEEAAAAIGG